MSVKEKILLHNTATLSYINKLHFTSEHLLQNGKPIFINLTTIKNLF